MPTSLPEYESFIVFTEKVDFAAWPSSYYGYTRRIDLAQVYKDTLIAAQQHRQREQTRPNQTVDEDLHISTEISVHHSEPPSPTSSTTCLLSESKSSPSKFTLKVPTWILPKKRKYM